MYTVIIITTSGNLLTTSQEKKPDLAQCQKTVGGYIETVPYFTSLGDHKRGTAYCNEEGKIHGLPFNPTATRLWREACPKGDPGRMDLHGDVIFYAKG